MDIERRLLEQSIEELFENAPCGFLSTRSDGTIVQINQTFVDMTGFSREWLLSGQRFAELLTVPGRIYHETHFGPLLQMQGFIREVAFDVVRERINIICR